MFTAIQFLTLVAVLPRVSGHAGTHHVLVAFASEI